MSLKNFPLILVSFLIFIVSKVTAEEELVSLQISEGVLHGTLLLADSINSPVALFISGSGPTDRDGNQHNLKNNSLKMLAESLRSHGISSLRYDKRAIAKSKIKDLDESELRFEDYVEDASAWLKWLKETGRFSKFVVIGHSEGSLVGMLAAQNSGADKFISLAGPGKSADKILKEQLSEQRIISYLANPLIDELVLGKTVKVPFYSLSLKTLFRPSVQPYLISWFKYDPSIEINKLKIESLIIQGTTDIQVSVEDAYLLANANDRAELRIIEGMNHILKNSSMSRIENLSSYNKPDLPINEEIIGEIVTFLTK